MRKSYLRFTLNEDLLLLREVLGSNPFLNEDCWKDIIRKIREITKRDFSDRAVKERLLYLIKLFKNEDRGKLRKSGTEEQYDEKEKLLQEIVDMEREFCKKRKRVKSPVVGPSVQTTETVQVVEEKYVIPMPSPSESNVLIPQQSKTPTKRIAQTNTLQYLKEGNATPNDVKYRELEIEAKRLEIEERKLELEEKKFEFEKEMKRKKIEMSVEERKYLLDLVTQQDKVIDILINKSN